MEKNANRPGSPKDDREQDDLEIVSMLETEPLAQIPKFVNTTKSLVSFKANPFFLFSQTQGLHSRASLRGLTSFFSLCMACSAIPALIILPETRNCSPTKVERHT